MQHNQSQTRNLSYFNTADRNLSKPRPSNFFSRSIVRLSAKCSDTVCYNVNLHSKHLNQNSEFEPKWTQSKTNLQKKHLGISSLYCKTKKEII